MLLGGEGGARGVGRVEAVVDLAVLAHAADVAHEHLGRRVVTAPAASRAIRGTLRCTIGVPLGVP